MTKEKICELMTLEEKAALLNGGSFFGTTELKRLSVPRLQLLDGGTGMNFEQLFGDICTASQKDSTNGMIGSTILTHVIDNYFTPEQLSEEEHILYEQIKEQLDAITGMPELAPGCFPPGILLGATFDPEIVYRVGEALGLEASAYHIDILLGTPNVNIHRDPLNGRLFEGYSEDPCVVATLAPALVKGVQSYPVLADVKHFAANNQETNRIGINETISERALNEIYFPGFRACVREGNVRTVMSAYNRINGVLCTENTWLLEDVLRKQWGFDGVVISDWGAVMNPVNAIKGGNDLAMPGPRSGEALVHAVCEGTLSEELLNRSVMRMLGCIEEIQNAETTGPQFETAGEIMCHTDRIAYEAALSGIIMLKNENSIFPIVKESQTRLTLLGSGRRKLLDCGTGSAGINTNRTTDLNEELCKGLQNTDRCRICDNLPELSQLDETDVLLVVAQVSGMEGNDRMSMDMSAEDCQILNQLICDKKNGANYRIGLILNTCGPVDIAQFEPYIDGIFAMFFAGMQGAKALAHLLLGLANPSGKLPLSYPAHYRDTPTCLNFPGDGYEVNYGEGIYVGYRYYDKKGIRPLYPFGYGCSYTRFRFYDITTDKETFCDTIQVHVGIQNIGSCAGSEVIQIYVTDVVSTCAKPIKELKAFRKVHLAPGESKEITFDLHESDFSYYDGDYHRFLVEEGLFDITVATSSRTEDAHKVIRVRYDGDSPYSYGLNSTMKVIYEQPELKQAFYRWWRAEGLDVGAPDSCYQYANHCKLSEFLGEEALAKCPNSIHFKTFMEDIKKVQKL